MISMNLKELLTFLNICFFEVYGRRRRFLFVDSSGISVKAAWFSYVVKYSMMQSGDSCNQLFGALLLSRASGLNEVYFYEESSRLLVGFLVCRLFGAVDGVVGGVSCCYRKRMYLHQAVKLLKEWANEAYFGFFWSERCKSTFSHCCLHGVESILLSCGVLAKGDCAFLAQLISNVVIQKKNIYFLTSDAHMLEVSQCLLSSVETQLSEAYVEDGVFISVNLPIESRMLLEGDCREGGILLFSCSLEMRGAVLEDFLTLVGSIGVSFLGSQRLMCCELKELLFDMGIVSLERLSLCVCDAIQHATGATPFHTEHEFCAWAEYAGSAKRGFFKVGMVRRATLSREGGLWIYGKNSVATIVIPVGDPITKLALLEVCEKAAQYAYEVYSGSMYTNGGVVGICCLFLAEYIWRRLPRHGSQNAYLRHFAGAIHAVLVSHAICLNPSLVEPPATYVQEVEKIAEDHAKLMSSMSYANSVVGQYRSCRSYVSSGHMVDCEEFRRSVRAVELALDCVSLISKLKL
ncbi:hypothetical protein, conserved [Trypanosoma brucei gambiense DAL972]|uniref:Uncharacterized protein n=2 Tax=Trypanosoma brucei TaxID=5691 RepID=C9ZJK5_TRYB9|nr:hypothetical protein, conserved [Trypanosoma brucei gambiense DAL972]CBH09564.1 hypothetical protein, conserved [Trypanosoma brucei gambiense DAL972]|eukprot:XP_011771869.1 hypothetical protein, conserved [Trypanosoma brucei gambiense DAL972]